MRYQLLKKIYQSCWNDAETSIGKLMQRNVINFQKKKKKTDKILESRINGG